MKVGYMRSYISVTDTGCCGTKNGNKWRFAFLDVLQDYLVRILTITYTERTLALFDYTWAHHKVRCNN